MRTRSTILIGALLLAPAAYAQAQDTSTSSAQTQATPATTSPKIGQVDFGFYGNNVTGDEARYSRYRDLRDGAYGYLDQFRFTKENETTFFHAEANRVGYRDQRYSAQVENIGRLKASFDWNQIPLYIGSETRTLFSQQGGGVLTIDNAIRQAIQDKTTTLAVAATGASPVTIRDRRDIGAFNMTYAASRDVDLRFNLSNTHRSGDNLMSSGFGFGGTNTEFAVPVDDRTTNLNTAVEWANEKGLLSVGYDGSWYDNKIPSLTWDNPSRATDASNLSSKGRLALWPTNNANTVRVNGSIKLPYRSHATAAVSFGRWSQDAALVPNTINTALTSPALERSTAEAKADIASTVLGFTSRPTDALWLNARYRYYDYTTKTPTFENQFVLYDSSLGSLEETAPVDFRHNTFDADASYSAMRYLGFGAGFTREDDTRTDRAFGKTAENSVRVSMDSTGNQYVTARLKYEYSKRTGSEFDEAVLTDAGEHADLLRFDIAPRTRKEVLAMVTVTPVPVFAVNGTVGTGRDNYPDSYFGLRDNNHDSYSIGFDVVPNDVVTFGLNYGFEKYTALQWSRDALPTSLNATQFYDPTRDWNINATDKVKTWSANLDLLKALPKTDMRFSYDMSDGNAAYLYGVVANSTLPAPVQYTTQPKNRTKIAKADLQYFIRPNVAFGGAYWYEDYSTQDPTLNPALLQPLAVGAGLYSGYAYQPYKANTFFLRMRYLW